MQFKIMPKGVIIAGIFASLIFLFTFSDGFKNNISSHISSIVRAFTLQGNSMDPPFRQAGLLFNEVGPPVGEVQHGLPSRLVIPKINVNSNVEPVGLTKEGAMDTPKKIEDVAWFELGIHPGEIGSAVIGGHYGWKDSRAAAFDDLHTLKKGDVVFIKNDKGATISFVVREVKKYAWRADSRDVFVSSDGKSHLNLITCEGTWNKAEKSYSDRLVVFTDKVIE